MNLISSVVSGCWAGVAASAELMVVATVVVVYFLTTFGELTQRIDFVCLFFTLNETNGGCSGVATVSDCEMKWRRLSKAFSTPTDSFVFLISFLSSLNPPQTGCQLATPWWTSTTPTPPFWTTRAKRIRKEKNDRKHLAEERGDHFVLSELCGQRFSSSKRKKTAIKHTHKLNPVGDSLET